ncbi:MAG: CBS domain-containing protein [Ardenticatenia bacterium]|nr:CBS domain-containing protein [Ardenticatenia bacterium]
MLPAFPLDGGRVVRALLAYVLPYRRATVLAVRVGQAVAIVLGGLALLGQPLLAVIAFFVFVAAGAEIRRVAWREHMGALRVGDFMRQRGYSVSADQPVSSALAAAVRCAQHVWPVVERGKLVGLITPKRLRRAPTSARVRDVMDREYPVLAPHMTLYEAPHSPPPRGTGGGRGRRRRGLSGAVLHPRAEQRPFPGEWCLARTGCIGRRAVRRGTGGSGRKRRPVRPCWDWPSTNVCDGPRCSAR